MHLGLYVVAILLAGILSAAGLLAPAVVFGAFALGLALRKELRWVANRRPRIRAPRPLQEPGRP